MSKRSNNTNAVEIRGEGAILRDQRPSDIDARMRWLTVETEWGEWDAPWEGNDPLPPERIEEVRVGMLEAMRGPLPEPRTRLFIQATDGPLLGWVSYYDHDPVDRSLWVGIDICESGQWGRGLGTQALGLWVGYLFANLDLDCIRMSTWSGNARMIRVGEKLGFVLEERIPNTREVRGLCYDTVRFVLNKSDWEARA